MLKLKLQYVGHLIRRTNSLEKTLMLGKNKRQKEKRATEDETVRQHHRLMDINLSKPQETVKDREA